MGITSGRWDYQRKQQMVSYVLLFGMIIGEFLFIFLFTAQTARLTAGLITQAQFDATQQKITNILIIYVVGLFGLIIGLSVWMKLAQVEYEKEQIALDSFQCVIKLDDFDEATYLIQTDSDSTTEITTTEHMLRLLEQSETYQSILKAVKSGVNSFNFDQANFLKKKLDEDIKKLKEQEAKAAAAPQAEDEDEQEESPELEISFEEQTQFIESMKRLKNLIPIFQSETLHLYYRPIRSIRRIDDPELDPDDEDDRKQDRLSGLTGMIYLLPDEEKDIFRFRPRLGLHEWDLTLRKAYVNFELAEFVTISTAFFIDSRLLSIRKANAKTQADAKVKALSFLTHLALDRDQELRDEIEDLRIDIVNLNRELDKKRDAELLKLLHSGELESEWRNRFTFGKINATAGVLAALTFLVGWFIGMMFAGGG